MIWPFSQSSGLTPSHYASFNNSEVQFWLFHTFQLHSMAVFQPWIQAPSAPVPDLFSPSSRRAICCCHSLSVRAPWACQCSRCHSRGVAPHSLQSVYPNCSWQKIPVTSLLFPSLLSLFWILGIKLSTFTFCIWNNIILFWKFYEKQMHWKVFFSKFFTNIWKY